MAVLVVLAVETGEVTKVSGSLIGSDGSLLVSRYGGAVVI